MLAPTTTYTFDMTWGPCVQDIERHTFSNNVTWYRLLGSRCNKCAVVNPAIPVPTTATVLGRCEWAFSMAKGCPWVTDSKEIKICAGPFRADIKSTGKVLGLVIKGRKDGIFGYEKSSAPHESQAHHPRSSSPGVPPR